MKSSHVLAAALCAAVSWLPQGAAAQTVSSFTVINADTGAEMATFTSNGEVSIDSTPRINIRANASSVRSVVFTDGSSRRTENTAPYAYKGNNGPIYNPWTPAVGTYVITAAPFASSGGTGTAGPAATLTLKVTKTQPPPPPPTPLGHLIIDPNSVHHFAYDRDNDGDGQRDPAFLAGAGGPEGFLYLSAARRQEIINRLLRSPALASAVGGLYFHSTRAFGGDGRAHETPFVNNADPFSGLDPAKLASWRADLKKLDDAGVILWFNLFDDHSVPYGCKYNANYEKYASEIVNTFKDLKHLVWVTQEEYRWTSGSQSACSRDDNDQRQIGLAAAIRAVDPIHPIATHHMGGQAMAFPNDRNIRVFGQQTTHDTPEKMHDRAGKQGWGNWVYVMAEAHPWHKDLIDAELNNSAGRSLMRRSTWATAMAGGYVMMYDAFESGDPTDAMFDDLRRLKLFMEGTAFNRMAPLFDDALTNAKLDGTKYVLSNPAQGLYILYGDVNTGKLGVRNAPIGSYALRWFDPVTGETVNQIGSVVAGGLASFDKPAGIGPEAVLYLRKR